MNGKIRVYSLDDNDETDVSVRKLKYDDMEVAAWRKPRAKVGQLVVDIKSPQGAHLATFDLADLIRLARKQFPDEFENTVSGELDSDDALFAELVRVDKEIQKIIEHAYSVASAPAPSWQTPREEDDDYEHEIWQVTFDRVFEGKLKARALELFDLLHRRFEWYDPDTTYRDDVTSFTRALHDRVEELKPQYPAVSCD